MAKKTNKPKDNTAIRVAIIAAVATLVTAIIGLGMPFAERLANDKNGTAAPVLTDAAAVVPSAVITATNSISPLIFRDSFETNLGIYEGESEKSFARVTDGAYRMGAILPHIVTWRIYNGIEVENFHLKVDIIMPITTKHYSCGIVFRQSDNGLYYFGLNNDQSFEFINEVDSGGESTDNTLADWISNIAIKARGTNELEIFAKQDTFELFVNGVKLKTITDNTRQKGRVGFYVSTYGGGGEAIVEFDNLLIEEQ